MKNNKTIAELVRAGDDLVSSIENCDTTWMCHPTIHMSEAIKWWNRVKEKLNGPSK